MNTRAESIAYRLYAGMPCPMSEERITQVVRVLGYSSRAPVFSEIPDDLARTLIPDGRPLDDPLSIKVKYAVEMGIKKSCLKRDNKEPRLIVPLSV